MDLTEYRARESERQRVADLMRMIPEGRSVLDIGARDGYLSLKLLERFESVTALDLERPTMNHERITCVQGDVTKLQFPANTFDVVLCAEVLEHIPPDLLPQACRELVRVAKSHVVIGVPFKQDIRVGRTTCANCGTKNPPWGHVNRFDKARLNALFAGLAIEAVSYVGESRERTNRLSALLLDWAGNPYGTYSQDEPCICCGQKLGAPRPMGFKDKVCAKLAIWTQRSCRPWYPSQPNWIHLCLGKNGGHSLPVAE